jgi:hypothetical protein
MGRFQVLKFVGWDDRVPVLLQPCGVVPEPEGTAPFYRLITDVRIANQLSGYPDFGATYTTAAQLSSMLNRCDSTAASTYPTIISPRLNRADSEHVTCYSFLARCSCKLPLPVADAHSAPDPHPG